MGALHSQFITEGVIMQTKDQYLRIKDIASYPARKEKSHIYKSGDNEGVSKKISERPASRGILSVSEKTIWQWVKQGKFPKPIKLSANVTVWRLSDVTTWIEAKALINNTAANDE